MVEAEALFRLGDAAEEAKDYVRARQLFEQGAALGHEGCLTRLALMFDVGIGVEIDKPFAMRCYRRAWRRWRSETAANNIAVLYREAGNRIASFQWFKRAAEHGDGDALVELAKCYLGGLGVRRSAKEAVTRLSAALISSNICEAGREEAAALLETLRPTLIVSKNS
jgi:TPR repeat protein